GVPALPAAGQRRAAAAARARDPQGVPARARADRRPGGAPARRADARGAARAAAQAPRRGPGARRSPMSAPDLVALPKAELHLHLEGTIRPATAAELADRYGLPMPRTGTFANLAEFVGAYEAARDLVGTLDDLRRVAAELVEDAAAQGVVWSEVHVVPPTYSGRL